MTNREPIGPETKGLRLTNSIDLAEFRRALQQSPRNIADDVFAWPLLTANDQALNHNLNVMAEACEKYGVWLAPHVKTHMSQDLFRRQWQSGAWAATVAMPHQLRAVWSWGVKRILLANELSDIRDANWLSAKLAADKQLEIWLEVDSPRGIDILAQAFHSAPPEVLARLHPLIEVGISGGRTGVRDQETALALARYLIASGLPISGVIGFEGPVAHDASAASLTKVDQWVDEVIRVAQLVSSEATGQHPGEPFIVSVGGSAYIDIVLPKLAALRGKGWQGVIRSGAYLTHDSVHYAELNPFSRLPGGYALQPALTVWAQVLSVPEKGLAIIGAGKRDLAFDLDLPVPLWYRRPDAAGVLGSKQPLPAGSTVTELNDQHTFMRFAAISNQDETAPSNPNCEPSPQIEVGDVIGFGISHPCTVLDKWRILAIEDDDCLIDIYPLDF